MIVYVTVFMSPHIISQCNKIYELTDGNFVVIETKEMTKEREQLGYKSKEPLPYVKRYRDDIRGCNKMILEAETVIYAEIPNSIINKRILSNKLTFYSYERLFKRGVIKIFHYKLWMQIWSNILAYKKNTHLLCDGSFVGKDFAAIGLSKKKMWKHGYFPVFKSHDITELISQKKSSTINILWVGRIIYGKKPIEFLNAIKLLMDSNTNTKIHVDIVGSGIKKLEQKVSNYISSNELQDIVTVHGLKSNETVFKMMQEANVFVSTSNRGEGWGAVVNEAMNSGCAVVASDAIGCAAYLIENGENGILYRSREPGDLCSKLEYLINNRDKLNAIARNAYYTIADVWNGEVAAKRLLKLIEDINFNRDPSFSEGPCSRDYQ